MDLVVMGNVPGAVVVNVTVTESPADLAPVLAAISDLKGTLMTQAGDLSSQLDQLQSAVDADSVTLNAVLDAAGRIEADFAALKTQLGQVDPVVQAKLDNLETSVQALGEAASNVQAGIDAADPAPAAADAPAAGE